MDKWAAKFISAYRFMRVGRKTGKEIEVLQNIKSGGTLTFNQDASYSTGTIDYVGELDLGADLIRVYLDADFGDEVVSEALGTFIVSAPKKVRTGSLATATAELSGRLSEIAEDAFDAPFTIPKGTNAIAYAEQLLEDAGFSDAVADVSTYTLSRDWACGIDTQEDKFSNRLSLINALLDAAGFMALSEDAYGRPVLKKYIEPDKKPIAMELIEGKDARFINETTEERDISAVANVVHTDYSTQDAFIRGVAKDSDPKSPYSTVSRGWRKCAVYTYNELPAGDTLQAQQKSADVKAAELLHTQQSVVHRVTLTRVYAPISLGDAVQITWRSAGIQGKYILRKKTLSLVAGCPCEMEVRRYER